MNVMDASKLKKFSKPLFLWSVDHSTQGISTSRNTLWLILNLEITEWVPRGHGAW